MKKIEKAVNDFNYTLKGNIFYTELSNDNLIDRASSRYYFKELTSTLASEMSKLGTSGLAQYLDGPLKSIIESIIITCKKDGNNTYSITKVVANKELTIEEKKELEDYIIDQFINGFGKRFEQLRLTTFKNVEEFYDENDEEKTVIEEVEYSVYANLWTNISQYNWR